MSRQTKLPLPDCLPSLLAVLRRLPKDLEATVTPELLDDCNCVAELLNTPALRLLTADPRYQNVVRQTRYKYAGVWAQVHTQLEYHYAPKLAAISENYDDFCRNVDIYPVFAPANELAKAEIELLVRHGCEIEGLKVAMIGPGALPYTGLYFASQGAYVTLIDIYPPACEWSEFWLQKLFPKDGHRVVCKAGEAVDYSEFDVVIVASMLAGHAEVLGAIERHPPAMCLVRSTGARRVETLVLAQVAGRHLRGLKQAVFLGESNPPEKVANVSFLYGYRGARELASSQILASERVSPRAVG